MRFIFLQLPPLKDKRKEDCKSEFDQWMYNLINMPKMERMAFTKEKSLFRELGDMAAYAALSEEDRMAYDADLKAYRDMIGQLVCAKDNQGGNPVDESTRIAALICGRAFSRGPRVSMRA